MNLLVAKYIKQVSKKHKYADYFGEINNNFVINLSFCEIFITYIFFAQVSG